MKNKGFSLVELIVVIAIMAILVGVAVPVYSSYIEKAEISKDKQLVDEVAHALQIAYAGEQFDGTATVVLTESGASVSGGSDAATAWVTQAMVSTFGSDWQNSLKLEHKWGGAVNVTSEVLAYFSGVASDSPLYGVYNGTSVPTFADDVDELFELVRDTSLWVSSNLDSTGAALVKGAAGYTTNSSNGGVYGDPSAFADAWSAFDSVSQMSSGYDENFNAGSVDEATLSAAVANAAIIKARNTAIATYLRDCGYGQYYDNISNLTIGTTPLPQDLAEVIAASTDAGGNVKVDELASALGTQVDENFVAAVTQAQLYFAPGENGETSPAYKDALAYYAMMDTVSHTAGNTSDNDEEYWNELAGAVSVYGDIAGGKISLGEISGMFTNEYPEGSVVVLVIANGGEMECKVIPDLG